MSVLSCATSARSASLGIERRRISMKHLIAVLALALMPHAALAHSIGVFADPLGTDCNLVVPYPGGSVIAYVDQTIDVRATVGANGGNFRIEGLPPGWTAAVTAGPDINFVFGNPFADGVSYSYPNCVSGTRVILVLS